MKIDDEWEQMVRLSDGTEVRLALVTPEDASLIRRGFDQLSDDTKYRRFLAAKRRLSDWELEYLSDVDQINHVAIGATMPHASDDVDGEETPDRDGIGIARFIRLAEETEPPERAFGTTAEAAITVVDAYQNKGLGTHLLEWLVRAGRERGIETFQCTLLAQNEPVKQMLKLGSNARVVERSGAVMTVAVDITEFDVDTDRGASGVLRVVGRGDASLPDESEGETNE